MKHTHRSKIEEAKELLHQPQTNVLACLTAEELEKLLRLGFKPDEYIERKLTVIHTATAEESTTASALIAKLDRHAEDNGLPERTVVHITKYRQT